MADQKISALTALISGANPTSGTVITVPSGDSFLIYGPSAGELDFNSLHIRMTASTASVLSAAIVASDEFSGEELGNYAVNIATNSTVYIGGKGFEGSRFKQTGDSGTAYCEIVCTNGASFYGDAVQSPYEITG